MVLKPSQMSRMFALELHKLPHLATRTNGFTLKELPGQLDAHLFELSPYHCGDERERENL